MREPELRLGSGPTDAQEIMSHAFFRNINWDDMHDKKVTPPFIPQIKNPTDTSNFDSEFTSVTPVLTPVQSGMSFLLFPYLFSFFCLRGRWVLIWLFFSPHPSHARRIPRLLLLSRLCMNATT